MPDSPRAFVSYSRADSEFALRLVEDLKAAGANVWLDQLDIEPGTPWDSAIEDALLASGHLLVILSNVSVTSDNVRDEISYALGQQMKVIPVLYQECKIPFRLARLQHIDFRNDYAAALKHLLRTLRVTAPAPIPPPPPEPTPQQKLEAEAREQAEREEQQARQKQAEELYRQEERRRAEERREEERKQREQAEVSRRAAELPKGDPTRIALDAIREALAQPESQGATQQAQREEELAQQRREERRQREQAEAARAAEEARKAAERKAEEVRQAEAAFAARQAARQAEAAKQSEAARKADEARKVEDARLAEENRLAEDLRIKAFAARQTEVTRQAQAETPQVERTASALSSLNRIVLYATVAGLARVICLIPMILSRSSVSRLPSEISFVLVGGITGLILCWILLSFKSQLSRKQLGPILLVWLAAGFASAALYMNAFQEPLLPPRILKAILPGTIAGAITGLTLARTLQNSWGKGILVGTISYAIPAYFAQFFFIYMALHGIVNFENFAIVYIALNFCAAVVEVVLLLWFIRNWGKHSAA